MTPEIKEHKTWEEAALWLARHGWGTNLIEQQKLLWDAAQVVVPAEATVKTASKVAGKPAAKAAE